MEKLKGSFYVDNCLTGVNDPCDLASFIERTQTLMSMGGFNLRGWVSNVACEFISKQSGNASVLGLLWNLDADKLRCSIDFEVLSCETVISKRLILSLVQKIFDPIEILCAVTLPPKILLQDTWKLKVGWDIQLPPDASKKFFKWVNELYLLKEVCLPRFMPFNEGSELHVFVDASRVAYSACVFVRTVLEAETSVSLIRAKTRVAPLKPLTIPRLELMACCIGARLVYSIRDALNLPNIKMTFWSDSDIALWGCSARRLLDSRWWEGPIWLKDAPENWPKGEICCEPLAAHTESKKSELVILNVDNDCFPWYCLKMSNCNRMINVFAYILRFVNNCQKNCTSINDSMLSFEELETVICGCESVINSRPLTYISEESRELVHLTPSMFLIENRCSDVTDFEAIDQGHFQKRIRFRSKLLNDLKQRFRREYLGQLVQRKKDKKYVREPRLGEIVLVGDDTKKRLLWPLAKIIELIPGKDGKVKTVRVKTQKGCMVRPIQRLFPLEIQSSDPQINMESGEGHDSCVSNPNLKTDTLSDAVVRNYTRSGRCIKTPEILDLLNCVSYKFECLIDPQRGENVGQGIKQKSERELE
ncbi:hypothetical protein AVEN_255564-1 [Araneus ventricosus]|uniref:DUF5641 domain-containing protein n=1 Tax=Araneus ventricosus TaxID=182803 RepID=A0A4Y2PG10_ARAVE|nr:hypothetical protein AVEN_255564-1 [Araneus ventricosus]